MHRRNLIGDHLLLAITAAVALSSFCNHHVTIRFRLHVMLNYFTNSFIVLQIAVKVKSTFTFYLEKVHQPIDFRCHCYANNNDTCNTLFAFKVRCMCNTVTKTKYSANIGFNLKKVLVES